MLDYGGPKPIPELTGTRQGLTQDEGASVPVITEYTVFEAIIDKSSRFKYL